MTLKVGIVGLPNVGKSTLFNALTRGNVKSDNYPFCTVDPNVGKLIINDERLDKLVEVDNPERIVKETIDIVDIAGLVRGASTGDGLGNQFLANIREVDVIIHVLRCFKDKNILHVENRIDPLEDKAIIDTELQIKDLESVEKRLEKANKLFKTGDKCAIKTIDLLNKLHNILSEGHNMRETEFEVSEQELLNTFQLLTFKPVVYVANVDVYDCDIHLLQHNIDGDIIALPISIGEMISVLTDKEKNDFKNDTLSWEKSVKDLTALLMHKLNMITFFTSGSDEARAWNIISGSTAPQAAGKIHTDFEKGFIKAEVCNIDDYYSYKTTKQKVLWRTEGKDYIVNDGDVVFFKI